MLNASQDQSNYQKCSGMYSKKAWGGSVDPYISVKFLNASGDVQGDPIVSLVLFEWKDEYLLGKSKSEGEPVGHI